LRSILASGVRYLGLFIEISNFGSVSPGGGVIFWVSRTMCWESPSCSRRGICPGFSCGSLGLYASFVSNLGFQSATVTFLPSFRSLGRACRRFRLFCGFSSTASLSAASSLLFASRTRVLLFRVRFLRPPLLWLQLPCVSSLSGLSSSTGVVFSLESFRGCVF
jgi:hypothetical protein